MGMSGKDFDWQKKKDEHSKGGKAEADVWNLEGLGSGRRKQETTCHFEFWIH